MISDVDSSIPLVVDLDGTLICNDTLHETAVSAFFSRPLETLMGLPALLSGRAALKRALFGLSEFDPRDLAYRADVVQLIRKAKAQGRKVHLVTAADQAIADRVAEHIGGFDSVLGSDGHSNLKGLGKLEALQRRFPQGFVYMGDSAADVPIWRHAKVAVLVGPAIRFRDKLASLGVTVKVMAPSRHSARVWLKQLRVHQWSKNLLIGVPPVLGHIALDPLVMLKTLLGFLAAGMIASATYALNDLIDLKADRLHATKRHRPLAAGQITILQIVTAALLLLGAGLVLGWLLSPAFFAALTAYLVLSAVYTLSFKAIPLLDVASIGALFTGRIVMGIALHDLPMSPWILSYSALFFTSMALAKRHVELMRARDEGRAVIPGRSYQADDWPITLAFGISTTLAAVVVLLLFVTEQGYQTTGYADPVWLYVAPACVMLWTFRIWLLSHRKQLDDDPVVFALRDRVSYILGAFVLTGFLAAL
ncbi:UbiA family prenyltransferase [Prosthecomicrobium sp. N25]|uniref:UbiA family prenyltransferase n=1 Tax=Prosthecomicrobium sp. N25 TaxID=3129254 RepID=UPI00307766E3